MTPSEWKTVVDEVKSLWGSSAKWVGAEKAVWKYARSVDADAAHATVERYFLSNKTHPPSPSEVISQTRTQGGALPDDTPCAHPNLGVLSWHDDGTAAEGICARCRVGFRWPAGRVRSLGELEADIGERIAGGPYEGANE